MADLYDTTRTFDDGMTVRDQTKLAADGKLTTRTLTITASNGDDPVLTVTSGLLKPAEFLLQYVHLTDEKTLKLAVERLFALPVAAMRWETEQGVGKLWVTYG